MSDDLDLPSSQDEEAFFRDAILHIARGHQVIARKLIGLWERRGAQLAAAEAEVARLTARLSERDHSRDRAFEMINGGDRDIPDSPDDCFYPELRLALGIPESDGDDPLTDRIEILDSITALRAQLAAAKEEWRTLDKPLEGRNRVQFLITAGWFNDVAGEPAWPGGALIRNAGAGKWLRWRPAPPQE